jgi:pimeloyl-ACP methyl ester carboxylesterase
MSSQSIPQASPLHWLRHCILILVLAVTAHAAPVAAAVQAYPPMFKTQQMDVSGGTQFVRIGGAGPAVVLLHGFGDTGDMWQPLAVILARTHTVVVPDLRGMGLSSHPEDGYTKVAQGRDLIAILDRLQIGEFTLVTHDIGNMVGYATAAQNPTRVNAWAVMDAPLPGLGSWDKQLTNPKVWHFNFRGPDVERLVAGRERILLDRFYNELSANPAGIDEATRRHYASLYARPGAIHNAFGGQFAAFATDAVDNQALFAKTGKLPMPILAIGGDHSYGSSLATELLTVASNVQSAVITNSGHWIMEEQPEQALALLVPFIASVPTQSGQKRLTSSEIDALPARVAATGTSGLPGISTRVLYGDPSVHGLYSIELSVPPNTVIEAHRHRDDRTATVVGGLWYFGYGSANDSAVVKALPEGSFYTEPGGLAHFARTGAEGAVVVITGYGPSDTHYVK